MSSAQDFLMGGGGAPAAKFETFGVICTGRILDEPVVRQQSDLSTGKLKYWDNGDPMNQLVVTLATEQRDPDDHEDDGQRRLFIKGQMQKVVRDAVRESGAKGLEVGGVLTITYIRNGEAKRGMNPPKEYTARYVPAAVNHLNTPQPAPSPTAAPVAAAQPAAPAPVAAPVAAAAPNGFDFNAMTAEQKAVMAQMFAQNQQQPANAPF